MGPLVRHRSAALGVREIGLRTGPTLESKFQTRLWDSIPYTRPSRSEGSRLAAVGWPSHMGQSFWNMTANLGRESSGRPTHHARSQHLGRLTKVGTPRCGCRRNTRLTSSFLAQATASRLSGKLVNTIERRSLN